MAIAFSTDDTQYYTLMTSLCEARFDVRMRVDFPDPTSNVASGYFKPPGQGDFEVFAMIGLTLKLAHAQFYITGLDFLKFCRYSKQIII